MRLALALFTLSLAQAAAGGASADTERGRALAVQLCSQCHVVEGAAGGSDAVPTFRSIANAPETPAARIRGVVLWPHPQMPTFDLSERDISDLAAYILSLRQ